MTRSLFSRVGRGFLAVVCAGALSSLSACAVFSEPGGKQASATDIDQMNKPIASTKLALILQSAKFSGQAVKANDAVNTGKLRAARKEANDLLRQAAFSPGVCQDLFIATYHDDPSFASATGGAQIGTAGLVRLQITAFPSVAEAQARLDSARNLAKHCASFNIEVPGASRDYQVQVADLTLPQAADTLALDLNAPGEATSSQIARVGNLILNADFDGDSPSKLRKDSEQSLGELTGAMASALVNQE